MRPRRFSPWMLPLLVLLAAWFPTHTVGEALPGTRTDGTLWAAAENSSSTNHETSAQAKSTGSTIPFNHRAIGMLCSFLLSDCPQIKDSDESSDVSLHGKASAIVSVEGEASDKDSQETIAIKKTLAEVGAYDLRVIIATVPDPTTSRMAPEFDRAIDAIQLAASRASYSLDRYYLPWHVEAGDRSEPHDAGSRTAASGYSDSKEDPKVTPGMILFRWGAVREKNPHPHLLPNLEQTPDRLLLVLLVGETPTTGVHKDAFLNALEETKEIQVDSDDPGSVRILGPAFSASALSIQETIDQWKTHDSPHHPNPPITGIISGSASAVDPDLLNAPTFRFHATIYSTETMMKAFLNYVHFELQKDKTRDPQKVADKIAVLRESNTVVGLAGAQSYVQITDKERVTTQSRFSVKYREIPFPLHISDLREGSATTGPTQDSSSGVRTRTSTFPFEKQTGQKEDVIPPFSSLDRAAVSLVMSNLLDTISREQIHYIAIHATDVQDIVYLAREINYHCPDTVIFTMGADILLSDPSLQQDLRGVLAISTYPLFNTNQLWTPPFTGAELRIQFANQESEGVYNAMLALLDHPDLMLEYGVPFTHLSNGPPIWLSVLGTGGPWPVTLLNRFADYPSSGSPSVEQPSVDPYLYSPNEDRRRALPEDAHLQLDQIDLSRSTLSRGGIIAFALMLWFAICFAWVQLQSLVQLRGDKNRKDSSSQPRNAMTNLPVQRQNDI